MKRLLFTIAMLSCILNKGYAQADKGDVELGLGVGLNFSTVNVPSDNNRSTDSKTALNFAFVGEYYFSDRWGIKSKLIYDQKGWGNGYVVTENENYITDYNVNYLTIPIMANWHFGSTRKWNLNFGPYVGFLLKAEDDKKGMDFKDAFNSTDVGIALGIGYKFPVSDTTKIYIEYDEQYGFTDVFADNTGTTAVNSRGSFNIGVLFTLK